jgi:hypothetical protein
MDKRNIMILVFVVLTLSFTRFSICQDVKTDNVQQPQIKLTPINAGGNEFPLLEIQSSVGYKVEILSDTPDNLRVTITGPVKLKQISETVFEVTLKLVKSEKSFNKWCKSKEAPYSVTFDVAVKDATTNKTDSKTGTFTFGKW